MIEFGNNSYIFNTYSAAGEKLMTQYQIQLHPVLSPQAVEDRTLEADGASGLETVTENLRSGPATPIDTDHIYYCGDVVYDRGITRLLTDEGYVTFSETGAPIYHYYLRDHLGNVRVVMGQTGNIEQVNHYYAFGGLMRESTSPGLQPYKYGGKEIDRFSGLDAYDFGARSYFADRMQWSTMDPLSEKYYDVSPYGYCHNNPVIRIDPNGEYDFIGINNNQYYPVIAVFPQNDIHDGGAIEYDYSAALNFGVPIMLVENINDYADAMAHLQGMSSGTGSYTINSHGLLGDETIPTSFKIGDDRVDADTDFSVLKNGLENHTVFIGACSVGNIQGRGLEMISNMAEQTNSTVIAPDHPIKAGYAYDGSNNLNNANFHPPMLPMNNEFVISHKGDLQTINNVTIDKDRGFSWDFKINCSIPGVHF